MPRLIKKENTTNIVVNYAVFFIIFAPGVNFIKISQYCTVVPSFYRVKMWL